MPRSERSNADLVSSRRENSWLLASVAIRAVAAAAPRPRIRPAGKFTRPVASVTALPIGSLPRDSSTISRSASGWALANERAKTLSPSRPLKVVSAMSVSITHMPAMLPAGCSSSSSLSLDGALAAFQATTK